MEKKIQTFIRYPFQLFYFCLNELNNKTRYIIDRNAIAHFQYDELGFN